MTQHEIRWPSPGHAARIESSARLQTTLRVLERAGDRGLTTGELHTLTESQAVHSDVHELRANGYDVECRYDGSRNGRRIYRYTLRGRRAA